ncbi:MAG: hypothetical protein QF645_12940, partial [Planctomycetota bacterium]|nr:hypothetical protein [Planctomycetota bacterium]
MAAFAGYFHNQNQSPSDYPRPGVVMIPIEPESRNEAETLQWESQFYPIAVAQGSETGGDGGDGGNGPGGDGPGGNEPGDENVLELYEDLLNAPEEPSAYNLNSLRMVRSTSDEFRVNEKFEFWGEGAQGTFYSGENERRETEKYAILLSGNGNAEEYDRPTPQRAARFNDGKMESSPKEYNGECEKVSPSYMTGMKYGIYTKTIMEPGDSQGGADGDSSENGNGSGILAVCRIDANGPEAGTRDRFPDYTAMLPKRRGVLFEDKGCDSNERIFVGEPVIVVVSGGDRMIPSGAGSLFFDGEGQQFSSFYGVECRGTNTWTFRAEEEGFDSTRDIRTWYRKRVDHHQENSPWVIITDVQEPGEIEFTEGRWWVKLEYTDRQSGT